MSVNAEPQLVQGLNQLNRCLALFANAIPRHWPNTADEARRWVKSEIFHQRAQVYAVHGIDAKGRRQLAATWTLVPLRGIMGWLPVHEVAMLRERLGMERLYQAWHLGGVAVRADFEGQGIVRQLLGEHLASLRPRYTVVGHTARPSEQHPNLRMLPMLLRHGWREMFPYGTFWYDHERRLEKVWVNLVR